MSNISERRRMQNRVAQRKFREKQALMKTQESQDGDFASHSSQTSRRRAKSTSSTSPSNQPWLEEPYCRTLRPTPSQRRTNSRRASSPQRSPATVRSYSEYSSSSQSTPRSQQLLQPQQLFHRQRSGTATTSPQPADNLQDLAYPTDLDATNNYTTTLFSDSLFYQTGSQFLDYTDDSYSTNSFAEDVSSYSTSPTLGFTNHLDSSLWSASPRNAAPLLPTTSSYFPCLDDFTASSQPTTQSTTPFTTQSTTQSTIQPTAQPTANPFTNRPIIPPTIQLYTGPTTGPNTQSATHAASQCHSQPITQLQLEPFDFSTSSLGAWTTATPADSAISINTSTSTQDWSTLDDIDICSEVDASVDVITGIDTVVGVGVEAGTAVRNGVGGMMAEWELMREMRKEGLFSWEFGMR